MSGKPIKMPTFCFRTNKSWKHWHSSSRPKPPRCNFNKRQPYRITQKRYWRQWRTNQKGIFFLFWCIFIFDRDHHSEPFPVNIRKIILRTSDWNIFTWGDFEFTKGYKIWSTLVFEGDSVTWCIFDPFTFGVWTSDFQNKCIKYATSLHVSFKYRSESK